MPKTKLQRVAAVRSNRIVGHSRPLLWTCDKCGDHPYRPERERLIGLGCVCGGTYQRVAAMPNKE